MSTVNVTNEAAQTKALAEQTRLASSKLRLFKSSLTPSINTTREQLLAAEADFSGYSSGGLTVTAWTDPVRDPRGGWSIESGLKQFTVTDPDPDPIVPNDIGGYWVETVGGKVDFVVQFDASVEMAQVGDGIPLIAVDLFSVQ